MKTIFHKTARAHVSVTYIEVKWGCRMAIGKGADHCWSSAVSMVSLELWHTGGHG